MFIRVPRYVANINEIFSGIKNLTFDKKLTFWSRIFVKTIS